MSLQDLKLAIADGRMDPTSHMEWAVGRIEELEAANDAAEKSHRISDNGNLWRFWSDKARELAHKNVELSKALKEEDHG